MMNRRVTTVSQWSDKVINNTMETTDDKDVVESTPAHAPDERSGILVESMLKISDPDSGATFFEGRV